MLIRIRDATEISASEITAQGVYRQRRRFLRDATALATLGLVPGLLLGTAEARDRAPAGDSGAGSAPAKFTNVRKSAYSANEKPASYADVTTYNNFYEFGTDKSDPARHAGSLKPRPWSVAIEGEVRKPAVYTLEDLLKGHVLEERIYRLRCVEAWSMVIPWVGIPLGDVIKRLGPTGKAKFVEFTTLHDPVQMPGQRPGLFGAGIDWPYVEGLRMDEAMHPLTILAVGLYGEVLPNQNGAPLRLVVPWKYGFKSIKSIVKMRFVEKPTQTTWMKAAPREYGFYANVNPQVDHPRWSQASERRIGEGSSLFSPRRKTLMFNGYAEQVAHLYAGMDLRRYY